MTPSSSQESHPGISYEREFLNALYIGTNIENILYGIALLLYYKTIRVLLSPRGAHKRSNLLYALFSSIMVFSITVWVCTRAIIGDRMWLLQTGCMGGPYAWWKTNLSAWYMEWSRVAAIILQLMTDALMLYRCRIIWNSYRVVVVPFLLWLATLALGILIAWTKGSPGEHFHPGVSTYFSLAYWCISVFLNTTLTCMICYRVLRHGRKVQEYLGHEYASFYFSVATIVIESVLPYTLSGIAFLVALGMKSPTSVAFFCVYFMMMCISPQMLILRVIMGSGWNNDTFGQPLASTVKFSPDDTSGLESLE
ncbi:hypothetical protein EV363DRAFT_1399472 [Boletus edulis]|nr:hypothetical protein EV363DRAFT_1399472 [Boletus edulis]